MQNSGVFDPLGCTGTEGCPRLLRPGLDYRLRRRLPRAADQGGELAQGTGFKEDGELKVHLKCFLNLGNEADADERMAAEREEVVVQPDLIHAQQLLPPARQSCLDAVLGSWRRHGGRLMRLGRRSAAQELLQRLRDSDDHGGRIDAQNAGQGARTFERQNARPRSDFDELFPVAANGIAGRAGVFYRFDWIGDAAHGKAFNLRQHLILFIEDGDVEGLHFAAQRILAPFADMAEEPAGKWAKESHLFVRQGKEKSLERS